MASLSGVFNLQQFTDTGALAANFRLYTYTAGTTTNKTAYTDAAGLVPHTYTNDGVGGSYIALNARGELPAPLYLTSGSYDLCLKTTAGATVWTRKAEPVSDSSATLTANLASQSSASYGAGMVGFSYAQNYAVGTIGWSVGHTLGIDMTQPPYSCDTTGATDISTAVIACWAANPGIPMRFPRGTYRVSATIPLYVITFSGAFGNGPKIAGDGIGATIFDNRVANNPMFDVDSTTGDSHATFKGVLGVEMRGFSIITTTSPTASTAIRLRTSYMARLEQIRIVGMTADGIRIPTTVGDNDGSNMVSLRQLWIESCAGWGLNVGDTGHNETSGLVLEQVFFQSCGTASASTPPPSGGMKWVGQILAMDTVFFANGCQNVGLYIPGQAGLAQSVDLRNVAFENCVKRSLYCTGVTSLKGRNVQFYNNDAFVGTTACEFDGTSYSVRQVRLDGCVVRATSGNNPYTAFKISGANADLSSCRVTGTVWDNFGYAGQTRFNGWYFDGIQNQCRLEVASGYALWRQDQTYGFGGTCPIRLSTTSNGTTTTGEWVPFNPGSSGVIKLTGTLTAATVYYVYLYDVGSGSAALEFATSAPVLDTSSGYMVKTGDASSYYCGAVKTDGAGTAFLTTAVGWLNPEVVLSGATATGTPYYRWTDSTLRLRVKATAPTSDTDGALVGTQT